MNKLLLVLAIVTLTGCAEAKEYLGAVLCAPQKGDTSTEQPVPEPAPEQPSHP